VRLNILDSVEDSDGGGLLLAWTCSSVGIVSRVKSRGMVLGGEEVASRKDSKGCTKAGKTEDDYYCAVLSVLCCCSVRLGLFCRDA
jgi:hypothetical protein